MPSLRFANPVLQARFVEGLAALPFAVQRRDDGAVVCTDEQWRDVSMVAHRVRDGCFRWFFSWCKTEAEAAEFEDHLRQSGVPFELEHHDDGLVFLLPQDERDKIFPTPEPGICSFCGASHAERQYFHTGNNAAICGACVLEFHELQSKGGP